MIVRPGLLDQAGLKILEVKIFVIEHLCLVRFCDENGNVIAELARLRFRDGLDLIVVAQQEDDLYCFLHKIDGSILPVPDLVEEMHQRIVNFILQIPKNHIPQNL